MLTGLAAQLTPAQARKAGLTMPITTAVHWDNRELLDNVLNDARARGRQAHLVLNSGRALARFVEVWAEPVPQALVAMRQTTYTPGPL